MPDVIALPDPGLGNTSWLVPLGDGSALVVDPRRDPRPYLAAAAGRGLRIRTVAETHLHADFVSGARELAAASGAQIVAAADADLAFAHHAVRDHDEVDLGGLTLQVVATPGHTPEHVAYLLADGPTPLALFSGGTLVRGGVARPDLIAPQRTHPLARAAWRSITTRLLALPDDLPVHPTHGGGSFCAVAAPGPAATTIGAERAGNPLLQAPSEDAFVDALLGGLGSYPGYFLRLRDVNRAGPRRYGTVTPALAELTAGDVDELVRGGAVVVDVRPVTAFAVAHVPGALSVELRDSFATWLGWLVDDPATPLVFVVGDDQDRDDLVRQCLGIGYEHLAGVLTGGIAGWTAAGRATTSTALLDRPEGDGALLDVRQASEWRQGHAAGALHIELGTLAARAAEVPAGRVVAHCVHGQRAMTAASVLERAGRDDVAVLAGSPEQWDAGTAA